MFKRNLQMSITHWMGAKQIVYYIRQGIREAYNDIQNLDKAMTNIAVVTNFNVEDLWSQINDYMAIAKQYGVTTQGVYEVTQLYYQQGLGTADVMEATTETLKMARIAGISYSDAADGMTVAIRAFKMEMEDAAHVTDVYSNVAAKTASDTQDLIEAMSKTASGAANVGSSFENTTAMIATMVD
jgi:TP901 family phage tail tape measure protein